MTCAKCINSEMIAISSETLLLTVGPRPVDLTQPFPMVVERPYELRKSLSCRSEAPCGALPALTHHWHGPRCQKCPRPHNSTRTNKPCNFTNEWLKYMDA
jgi:hypothetical protein